MALSRRAFLRTAGVVAAVAALDGCDATGNGRPGTSSRAAPTSSSPAPATSARTSVTSSSRPPAPTSLAQLRARLPGRLLEPADRGYDVARRSYDPDFDSHRPIAVAGCASPADVQACVEFAAASRTPIAARSGGHSYVGYSAPDRGLVADVGPMHEVRVGRDGTAVVGAGARLIDVYTALAKAGRCLPAGSCPTVGIAGLTLGGGIGLLARAYGLTCDRLVSAQVVTADATLRTASASSEPELFWALRGGGGGNLGIVTSFTFSTVPAPAPTVFALDFGSGSVASVLGAWQQWVRDAPGALFANCIVTGSTPPSCTVNGCYVGSPSGLNPLLDGLVRQAGTQPGTRSVQQLSYLDAMRYFAGCSQLSAAQCQPAWTGGSNGQLQRETFVASSRIVEAPMADTERVAEAIAGSGVAAIFDSLGGAVARIAPAATAFPHRGAVASVQIYHGGSGSAVSGDVSSVRDQLGSLLGQHGYVNYLDPTMPHWASAYYGSNLPRLRAAAGRYDPHAVFSFAQSLTRA
ncbi:MAG: FAD-binding oxidoreductase [Jatrophihabitantaceae bacterium]